MCLLDFLTVYFDPCRVVDVPLVEELLRQLAERDALIAGLQARIVELEARLGMNSTNSHKPPSSDGLAKPTPKSLRGKSGRKPGGQQGHPGHTLSLVDDPDERVRHVPQRCQGCGTGLRGRPVSRVIRRQVFDLPEPSPLRVTEHQIVAKRCWCGVETVAEAPAGVAAPASYGPRLRAVVVYLQFAQFCARWRTTQAVHDLFGVPISAGTVSAWGTKAAQGLEGFRDRVRGLLRVADVVGFDETSMRVDGANWWVHTASTPDLSLLTVHARRGGEGTDAAGVLPAYTGVAVHDAWAPYDGYTDATHALCNAHYADLLVMPRVVSKTLAKGGETGRLVGTIPPLEDPGVPAR